MLTLALALLYGCSAAASPTQQLRLERDGLWVELSETGVLRATPERGLRVVGGPLFEIEAAPKLCHSFSYANSAGRRQAVARGDKSVADWAQREDVLALTARADGQNALFQSQVGALELTTSYWYDANGPYLICALELHNPTVEVARDILIALEAQSSDPEVIGWTWPTDLLQEELAPRGLIRSCWMLDDLQPGARNGVGYVVSWRSSEQLSGSVDVPLQLWTNSNWPAGLTIGLSGGLAFGDYDSDGWYDLFSLHSGNLFRNDQGQDWQFIGDLRVYMNPPGARYGSSWADYNNDGRDDFATEPRGNACMHLLRNDSNGVFFNVATDPALVIGRVCGADAETNCWGDVDDDGDLDLFIPIYPAWAFNGPGNRFYENRGPVGPAGEYVIEDQTTVAGFENPPPDSARPEGAQFVDVDADGDLDLYSNGTLYQNNSSLGFPRMRWMTESGSGILYHNILDEGAALGDYDMDGDYDLFVAFTFPTVGMTIFENEGDGTFFQAEPGIVESPSLGIGLGLSIVDWDADGDLDFTARNIFRKNLILESAERRYAIATHDIPEAHISSASPAWADWDRDGDMDCGLANIGTAAHFYENTRYDANTPLDERRFLRVRPLRESSTVTQGLATEFGASVNLRIHGDKSGLVRRSFTSSSNGYLNQNEYPLTIALPADPTPDDPRSDLQLELAVDFPSLPAQGIWRVDRHVNPVLARIDFATLSEREIEVWRDGRVRLQGQLYDACDPAAARLTTAGNGLAVADPLLGLAPPETATNGDAWIGIDFDTMGATERVRLRELVLDGHLLPAVDCGSASGNVLLYDVSTPGAPVLLPGGAYDCSTGVRNHRSYQELDNLLERDRRYRLLARVDRLRASPFAGPFSHGNLRVQGGLSFTNGGSCPTPDVELASLDNSRLWLSFRFAAAQGLERYCISTINSTGAAALIDGLGSPSVQAQEFSLWARNLPPGKFAQVFFAASEAQTPFGDGFLCVTGHLYRLSRPTQSSSSGELYKEVNFAAAPLLLPGSTWRFQALFHDPQGGGSGFNTTDALRVTFCP